MANKKYPLNIHTDNVHTSSINTATLRTEINQNEISTLSNVALQLTLSVQKVCQFVSRKIAIDQSVVQQRVIN